MLLQVGACENCRVNENAPPGQLGLFGDARVPSRRDSEIAKRLEREHARAAQIARLLPAGVRFGTSSWSFPGWAGIVYSRRATAASLAREGLSEYARHPLLSTVGIDRTFYAPISKEDLARYAEQLPPGFPCCAKAPEAVTAPVAKSAAGRRKNPDFLRPERFLEEIVRPFQEAFADHTGPFVLQFPPAPASERIAPAFFAERLGLFLSALPRTVSCAVELRDPALLTRDYRAALEAHGAAHVYNYAGTMPMPAEQEAVIPLGSASFAMVRLLMPPGNRYEERREALAPFEEITAPDEEMRRQVTALVRQSVSLGRTVYVLVNNKAEGCAPLTIRALAEMLAGEES